MKSKLPLRLVPELIPEPLWGLSACRFLGSTSAAWRAIRAAALQAAGNACAACGFASPGGRYQRGDELWAYDEPEGIATLTGVRVLCPPCDSARHFGLAQVRGYGAEALEHLAEVNGLDEAGAQQLREHAWEDWDRRSELAWTVEVAPELVERFPALAGLRGLRGEPGEGDQRVAGQRAAEVGRDRLRRRARPRTLRRRDVSR